MICTHTDKKIVSYYYEKYPASMYQMYYIYHTIERYCL